MQSPLQVTIMATLVERIGEPPQERYRLFEQYYRTIYEREIGREGPLSAILSHRKTDIDTIHYRTGLLLQSESEIAGQTNALLSDERFRMLVRRRLEEVGVLGEQATELLGDIADSSLDRLVFLVRPRAGQVSFEIRSLQEFMAAEALLRGDDAAVIQRLKEIAPIAHWRNVLLFAIGKCFVDREYLLENIICICDELNEENNDDLSATALWGSRLALDILSEGIARANPTYESILTRNALRLLTFPSGAPHLRLAQVFHSGLEPIYAEAIADRLGQHNFERQKGAWATLTGLADRGIEWAQRVAIDHWPSNPEQQRDILKPESRHVLRPWSTPKLLQALPAFEPNTFAHVILQHPSDADDLFMPDWGTAAIAAVNPGGSNLDVTIEIEPGFKVLCTGPVSANSAHFAKLSALQKMPLDAPEWAPLIAGARFATCVDHQALSRELLWLAEHWNPTKVTYVPSNMPWPLLACLRAATVKKDLVRYAERARNKELGSAQDWGTAENRWRSDGITYAELADLTDETAPFDARIATVGFPIATANIQFDVQDAAALWSALRKLFEASRSSAVQSWAAWELLILPHRFMYRGNRSKQPVLLPIDAPSARELLAASYSRQKVSFLPLPFLELQPGLTSEWLNVLDEFGLQHGSRFLGFREPPWRPQLSSQKLS